MLLQIEGLTKRFGGLEAVSSLDMSVRQGDIVGLIGPNGAGKSTVFNLITGVIRPSAGKVTFDGEDITGKRPHVIAKRGIGRTFQLNPLFSDFTVLENIAASFCLRPRTSLLGMYFNSSRYRANEASIAQQCDDIVELVGLGEVRNVLAKNLPHGYQKMLGIGRAMATKPKLILLDEPLAGMNADEIEFTLSAVKRMRDDGVTVVVVEHNMVIMELCDHVVVINFGEKIAEGSADFVRQVPEVVSAYLGVEYESRD
jgi:branched-chain amino acid transport system ATP-binding protein